jgi:hypothetical protein
LGGNAEKTSGDPATGNALEEVYLKQRTEWDITMSNYNL